MAASFSDANQLAQDPTFQGRVGAGLMTYCQVVGTEGWTIAFHRERAQFAVNIFNATLNAQGINPYFLIFTNSVAADANVLADATVGGTVPITAVNRVASAALVTDVHISNAIAAQFNSYVREPNG
jgi:hypothetical protein